MPAPIELRHFMRLYSLDDAKAGMVPIRQTVNGELVLFAQPALQFRYLEKVGPSKEDRLATPGVRWSEWQDVRYVREDGPDDGGPTT